MRAVPIWWAENTVMPFFLMPAQAMQASAMHCQRAQAACAISWHCICLGEECAMQDMLTETADELYADIFRTVVAPDIDE